MECVLETSDRWLTVTEAAEYLSVTPATVYTYMKDERLPFSYLAGTRHRRIKKSDLEALLVPGNPNDGADDE